MFAFELIPLLFSLDEIPIDGFFVRKVLALD